MIIHDYFANSAHRNTNNILTENHNNQIANNKMPVLETLGIIYGCEQI